MPHFRDLAEALCNELWFRLEFGRAVRAVWMEEAARCDASAGAADAEGGGRRIGGLEEAPATVELMAVESIADLTPLRAARSLLPSTPAADIVRVAQSR
jgi:hypothetical protein